MPRLKPGPISEAKARTRPGAVSTYSSTRRIHRMKVIARAFSPQRIGWDAYLGLRPRLNIGRAVGPCQTTARTTTADTIYMSIRPRVKPVSSRGWFQGAEAPCSLRKDNDPTHAQSARRLPGAQRRGTWGTRHLGHPLLVVRTRTGNGGEQATVMIVTLSGEPCG
jgi:hypothetical protein